MKNKIRLVFQLIFLGLIGYVAVRPAFDGSYVADFEKYCPFGGLSSFASKINQGTMACNMSEVQVAMGLGLIAGVLLVGKLFCGYICPIGTVTEWLGRIGEKFKLRREMPKFLDRPLRSLKYGLLFITLYYTMTSSELFCKEFDPYFATANLFDNPDTVLYFSIPALLIAVLGTVFFRLFWCKYLCPLGAVSNIFMNVIGAAAVIGIYLIANLLGADLGFIWLIGGLVLSGLITELGFMRSFVSPLPKIERNASLCTSCGLCDKKCPQGIKISEMEKVNHIDCNLCTDCVYSCAKANTLTVKKKKGFKYLAPVSVVVLVLLSLGASTQVEFTTISERWGNFASLDNVESYKQTGVKNVKCYGSAMSLKGKLETVEGIVGLDAYASSHTVKIYYDPSRINERKVKGSLFTPIKQEVNKVSPSLQSLAIWEAGVFNLFDLYDYIYLTSALKKDAGVHGFETHFGEPVKLTLFYDPAKTNPAKIKKEIETDQVKVKKGEGFEIIDVDFRVDGEGKTAGNIQLPDYRKRIFKLYDREFNGYMKYKPENLSVFIFPMPDAAKPALRRSLGSLSSHLSADEGIVRLSTRYLDVPSGIIYFDPSKTDVEKIKMALTLPKLTIFTSDTETKELENPFSIKPEGKVVKATEISIDEEEDI